MTSHSNYVYAVTDINKLNADNKREMTKRTRQSMYMKERTTIISFLRVKNLVRCVVDKSDCGEKVVSARAMVQLSKTPSLVKAITPHKP